MLCYEPIPLFEANIYLSRKAAAFSISGFYERLIRRHADRESEYEPYFKALTELYSELDAVEIEKDAVLKLFCGFSPRKIRVRSNIRILSDYMYPLLSTLSLRAVELKLILSAQF